VPDKEGYPDKENFEVIQFDTTRKLLEKLTAAIVLDEFKWLNGAIYRGQADVSWGLTPKIFRQTAALPSSEHFSQTSLRELTTAAELDYEFQLIYIELILMERFLHYADQIGLAVKNDSMQLRQQIRSAKEEADKWASRMKRGSGDTDLQKDPSLLESWPAEWALQLLSLMQHHRLPTRFLDWTTKPLHAAYFAAEDAVRNRREGGCLAIYACPPNVFTDWVDERADADGKYHTYSNRHGAFSVQVPTSDNPNIVGQRGLFTIKAVSPDSHLNTVNFESYQFAENVVRRGVVLHLAKA
jgi:hypothetical protein